MFLQFIQYFILAGVLTHTIWFWNFKTTFIPKPSDFFFGLAIAGSIVYFLGKGRQKLVQVPKLLYAAVFIFGASIILGTIMGYLRYGIPFIGQGISLGGWHLIFYHFFRIGGGFLLLILVYILLKESPRFLKRLYIAFSLAGVVFIPLLAFPSLADKLEMLDANRFMGLAGNAGMLAILIFPSFVFLLFLLLRSIFKSASPKNIFLIFILAFFTFSVEALILWSGTRSYLGAVILTVILGVFAAGYIYKASAKKIFVTLFLTTTLAVALIFPFSYFVDRLTSVSKYPEMLQNFDFQNSEAQDVIESQKRGDVSTSISVNIPYNESRIAGFYYYFYLFKSDPLSFILGLGPNYPSKFSLKAKNGGLELGESIIFNIFLYGGILLAISLLLFLRLIWQRMKILFKEKAEGIDPIYILAPFFTLFGWWSAAVFLGTPFTLIPNWILLGMILVARHNNQ